MKRIATFIKELQKLEKQFGNKLIDDEILFEGKKINFAHKKVFLEFNKDLNTFVFNQGEKSESECVGDLANYYGYGTNNVSKCEDWSGGL